MPALVSRWSQDLQSGRGFQSIDPRSDNEVRRRQALDAAFRRGRGHLSARRHGARQILESLDVRTVLRRGEESLQHHIHRWLNRGELRAWRYRCRADIVLDTRRFRFRRFHASGWGGGRGLRRRRIRRPLHIDGSSKPDATCRTSGPIHDVLCAYQRKRQYGRIP